MDPITLFAMANAAVSAVKKGCQLYKDIKGAAGSVKDVLKDMDDQFHKLHPPEKPATVDQRNNFTKQRNEIVELNKKANAGEHTGIYSEIGDYLGAYYDNLYKCLAIFEEEERRSATEVYHGDASLGKRALQRVLMKKQLEQMGTELQELMIYQSPPELGALWTEVNVMMQSMGEQQKVLMAKEMQMQYAARLKTKRRIDRLWLQAAWGLGAIIVSACVGMMFAFVVEDRIKKYPHLGNDWTPKTEEQRRMEASPKKYIGR